MEYVKLEPSQHTVMEYTRRFSYRQSRIMIFYAQYITKYFNNLFIYGQIFDNFKGLSFF
jgi:hypothetical protein